MKLTDKKANDIRALTVGPLWAYAVTTGAKKIENRTWATRYRGPLLIHAGGSSRREDEGDVTEILVETGYEHPPEFVPRSAFVALVTLTEVVNDGNPGKWAKDPWFCGPFGFVLKRLMVFDEPVEAKGKLGLWRPASGDLRKLSKYLTRYGL